MALYVDDDLEDFIKTKTSISIQEINENVEAIPFRLLLQSFDNINRLHHSMSIRQYWQDLKLIKPELFRLAQAILSVPVTQDRIAMWKNAGTHSILWWLC